MDFSKAIDWIKLSPKYLFPISLASGFLIFSNEKILNIFGLYNFIKLTKPYIGIVFLVSTCLLISNLLIWILNETIKNIKNKKSIVYENKNFLS